MKETVEIKERVMKLQSSKSRDVAEDVGSRSALKSGQKWNEKVVKGKHIDGPPTTSKSKDSKLKAKSLKKKL